MLENKRYIYRMMMMMVMIMIVMMIMVNMCLTVLTVCSSPYLIDQCKHVASKRDRASVYCLLCKQQPIKAGQAWNVFVGPSLHVDKSYSNYFTLYCLSLQDLVL